MGTRRNRLSSNPMWKGGIDGDMASARLRSAVIKRDGERCSVCGSFTRKLYMHHHDQNRKNNSLQNFMLVCRSCHSAIHAIFKNLGARAKQKLKAIRCHNCKRSFHPRNRMRLYCSRKCYDALRPRKAPQRKCKRCGNLFFSISGRHTFCSFACYRLRIHRV